MKIYIAGSSKDIERCEMWRDRCIGLGIEITEDWMSVMRASPNEQLLDHERLVACAAADLRGVEDADYVWLLAPPGTKPSAGCWSELAWAFARGVPAVYSPPSGERPQFCIFTALLPPQALCASDDEAFAKLESALRIESQLDGVAS